MPKINQLTPKMEKFCECVASGMMSVDAYKESYNASNMNENSIRREAFSLMQRDDITLRIQELRIPLQNSFRNALYGESERIKVKLWEIIGDNEERTENKLRAMDILNKMNLAYKEESIEDKPENILNNIDNNQLKELININ